MFVSPNVLFKQFFRIPLRDLYAFLKGNDYSIINMIIEVEYSWVVFLGYLPQCSIINLRYCLGNKKKQYVVMNAAEPIVNLEWYTYAILQGRGNHMLFDII